MEKGRLRWKQCPGRAGSILAQELLLLLEAVGGPGSGSRSPVLPTASPGAPNAMGNESSIISAALLPFGSIPPLLSPIVPFPVEHPSLLQPWLHTLKDLFNTSQD